MFVRFLLLAFLAFFPSFAIAYEFEVTGRERTGENLLVVRGMQWNWGPDEIPETGRLLAMTKDVLLKGSETRVFAAEVGGREAKVAYQFYEGELFAIEISIRTDFLGSDHEVRFLDYLEFNDILSSKYGVPKDVSVWYDPQAKSRKNQWKKSFEEGVVNFDHYWLIEGIEISHKLPREGSRHSIWYTHYQRHSNVLGIIAQGRKDEL